MLKPNAVWRLKDHAGRRMSKPNAIWKRISPSGIEAGGSWCVVSEVAAPSNGLHQQGQNPVSAEPRGDDLSLGHDEDDGGRGEPCWMSLILLGTLLA